AMTTVAAPAPSTVELTNARRVVSSANASLKFSTDRFDRLLTFDQVSGGTPLNGGWTAAQARMMIGRPMENSRISPAPPAASQRPTGPRSNRLGRNALPLITANMSDRRVNRLYAHTRVTQNSSTSTAYTAASPTSVGEVEVLRQISTTKVVMPAGCPIRVGVSNVSIPRIISRMKVASTAGSANGRVIRKVVANMPWPEASDASSS